ncbi:site-specific integrase [Sphingobacterium bambusae]|uniref:Site-specific integrase n=1 Tax=Sphingobacterium bambusae TaxID=662858 RepID=A0ABW6BB39_9SPHI|nr:site-specific integrase [Sphingobacterium bambusae]WPL48455.1 site-specific integrase [Sphingobacterium bambusae]
MLERSFGICFFLKKRSVSGKDECAIHLRVTVDGVRKEVSTKRKWFSSRWDNRKERAIGQREDARTVNNFVDNLLLKINTYRNDIQSKGGAVTAEMVVDFLNGNAKRTTTVLEEFQKHNDEMLALVPQEYAIGTHQRYSIAKNHIESFIAEKYNRKDMFFWDLNYEFIRDYEFYLKTVRKCSANTSLKYISNFKKIVIRAIAKDIIDKDPFIRFKGKKTKPNKRPLTSEELFKIEQKKFTSQRLEKVRDVFVFQCYTGLAYIDAFQLKRTDIKKGNDGQYWIFSNRQKSGSVTDVPLLPKALEIIDKYKLNADCIASGKVLPVNSNQKMNEYLKEIAVVCGVDSVLNTHKARRTFASTIALKNGVPMHIVKEMLGHQSIKQTEEYAIAEQESVGREMNLLRKKLEIPDEELGVDPLSNRVLRLENKLIDIKSVGSDALIIDEILSELSDIKQKLGK